MHTQSSLCMSMAALQEEPSTNSWHTALDRVLTMANLSLCQLELLEWIDAGSCYIPSPSNYPLLDSKYYQLRTIRFQLRVVGRSRYIEILHKEHCSFTPNRDPWANLYKVDPELGILRLGASRGTWEGEVCLERLRGSVSCCCMARVLSRRQLEHERGQALASLAYIVYKAVCPRNFSWALIFLKGI